MKYPMEDARRRNWMRVLRAVMDTSFGTLFWVRDELWQRQVAQFRPSSKPRIHPEHPGVSLQWAAPSACLFDPIPLLFGTSGQQGPVVVRGMDRRDATKPTSFGRLLAPGLFGAEDFLHFAGSPPPKIHPNSGKPRTDATETAALRQWAEQRRLVPATSTATHAP